MSESLLFSNPEQGILQITLHRPEAYNALNTAMLCDIGDRLEQAVAEPEIRCVIITGDKKPLLLVLMSPS